MEALNNLADRVDRLTAMVESAIQEHVGEAADAVLRGVQSHAEVALSTGWWAMGALLVAVILMVALAFLGFFMSSDVVVVLAGSFGTIGLAALIIVGGAFLSRYPTLYLEATDPAAAIARDFVLR